MLALITKESDDFRTVRFNPTEDDIPKDTLFVYTHLMPIEVQRLRECTLEEVQQILRRYI